MQSTKFRSNDLLQLSSTFSKMFKRRFGKGPESCFVYINDQGLIVHIRNFMTPAEEALLQKNEIDLASNFRTVVADIIAKEFEAEVYDLLGISFDAIYYDWNYIGNTGILFMESKFDFGTRVTLKNEKLLKYIEEVGATEHKTPDSIHLSSFNNNILTAECKGVMLQIETTLLEKGYINVLKERSREVTNKYNSKKALFEEAIGRKVENVFITWDYLNDRNFLIFYLK